MVATLGESRLILLLIRLERWSCVVWCCCCVDGVVKACVVVVLIERRKSRSNDVAPFRDSDDDVIVLLVIFALWLLRDDALLLMLFTSCWPVRVLVIVVVDGRYCFGREQSGKRVDDVKMLLCDVELKFHRFPAVSIYVNVLIKANNCKSRKLCTTRAVSYPFRKPWRRPGLLSISIIQAEILKELNERSIYTYLGGIYVCRSIQDNEAEDRRKKRAACI